MITRCPKCKRKQPTPDVYASRLIKCVDCKADYMALEYREPEPEPVKIVVSGSPQPESLAEPPAPALVGILSFFAWASLFISVIAAIPTFGASLAGIIPAAFLAWAAQVLRNLNAQSHYLRMLAVRATRDDAVKK